MRPGVAIAAGIAGLVGLAFAGRARASAALPAADGDGEGTALKSPDASASSLPRGLRNNNPGNIEWVADPARRWRGMIAKDGRYGIFDTPNNGVRAIGGELRASIRKGQTIAQAITEWAPEHENPTSAYIANVARAAQAQPGTPLHESHIPAIAGAIIKQEVGYNPWSAQQVSEWVRA